MILIISHEGDEHAVTVMQALEKKGSSVILFDTAQFPGSLTIAADQANGKAMKQRVVVDGKSHDLSEVNIAWWRRPLPFELAADMASPEDRSFAYGECDAAISGLWSSLDTKWVNEPDRDQKAARKLWQLGVASNVGLTIPDTLVTNNPDEAREFIGRQGKRGTIYKAFSATEQSWRETRLLKPEEMEQLDAVSLAPVIFQEHVRADIDLRITAIGDQLFPAEILSGETDYKVDFRMTMNQAKIRPHKLPKKVEKLLLKLMGKLKLNYGAIDMRLTPEGKYVFLEVNPAGQWLFIEERTGQPITEAMVSFLREADDD